MNTIVQSHGLIEQLMENGRKNKEVLGAAGLKGEGRMFRCSRCGLFESLLFWNLAECGSGSLEFRCPSGCATRIRFATEAKVEARAGGSEHAEPSGGSPTRAPLGKWLFLPLVFFVTAGMVLSMDDTTFSDRLRSIYEAKVRTDPRVKSAQRESLIPGEWLQGNQPVPAGHFAVPLGVVGFDVVRRSSLREAVPVQVLIGKGDRREEVAALVEQVATTYGATTRSAVQSIQYSPDADATQVVVQPELPAWKAYFAVSLPGVLSASSLEPLNHSVMTGDDPLPDASAQ